MKTPIYPIFLKICLLGIMLIHQTACAESHPLNSQELSPEYLKVIDVTQQDTLNLRVSANSKSNIVSRIPYNASGILMSDESNGWIYVQYKHDKGWAYHKYLAADQRPDLVSAFSSELHCIGTEPHWNLRSHGSELTLKKYDESEVYILSAPVEQLKAKQRSWKIFAVSKMMSDKSLEAQVNENDQCSDEMSDDRYQYSVEINDRENNTLIGCCNRK